MDRTDVESRQPASGNHDRFLSHLELSKEAVWQVAKMLSDRGYNVTIPSAAKAAKHEEWKQYADNGDLYVSQRVEVKQLSADFTGAADWPFGTKFIVCAKHAFDRATPKPFAYLIISRSGKHAAAVFCSDASKWAVESRTDKRYAGVSQEFYFAPMETVRFFAMPRIG